MNFDSLLRTATAAGDVPGVVAAVTTRKDTVYEAAFGQRALGEPAAMSFDTVCWLASMTKPLVRAMLDGMSAVHTGKPYGVQGIPADLRVSRSIQMARNNPEADRETLHPVVRVHPDTGRKALFVNAIYTQRFENMTAAESKPLLEFLFAHAIQPEFTCRLRWAPGSLAMWDNRCTMHYAINDYDGQRRLMHRITVAGERPAGPRRNAA